MKLITINALILVAFVLTACGGNSEKFVGFTAVSTDKDLATFYIDTNTVRRRNSGLVSFNMVRVLPNGYAIQNAETDCKTSFNAFEGVKFREDGTSQEKYIAKTLVLPSKDNSDVNALITMACDKAEEYRIITGAFTDSKALEIVYGSYQPTTQTALWQAIEPPSTLKGYENFLGKSGTVKILDSKDFIQQGKTKHAVLTSTSVTDSSQVLLNAAIFVKIDDKWYVEAEYPYLKMARNDLFKNMYWEQLGKEHYGIVSKNLNEIDVYEIDGETLKHILGYENMMIQVKM